MSHEIVPDYHEEIPGFAAAVLAGHTERVEQIGSRLGTVENRVVTDQSKLAASIRAAELLLGDVRELNVRHGLDGQVDQ